MKSSTLFFALLLASFLSAPSAVFGQRSTTFSSGEIQSIKNGEVGVRNSKTGKTDTFYVQAKGVRKRFPDDSEVKVSGTVPIKFLEVGSIVQFSVPINSSGKSKERVKLLKVVEADEGDLQIKPEKEPKGKDFVSADVIARVEQVGKGRLKLIVAKSAYARRGKLTVSFAKDAKIEMTKGAFSMVMVGDTVKTVEAIKLTNGAYYASKIEIELTGDRDKGMSFDDQIEQQFSALSDEPGQPREVRSRHFLVYTDVSEKSAAILLAKLERMYGLIGGYLGKRPRQPIECYVIRPENLKAWSDQIPPAAAAKIAEPAGVTRSLSRGRVTISIVYSCSDHGIVQHEAVHAFCAMAFGSTGPVWYAEGMAEMGQHWRDGQLEVRIPQGVISYLTRAEPKKMRDIVAAGQITGDSWQAYAWRWALCHLLANNPNYAARFKRLGLSLMSKGSDSFDKAFGPVAPQISFEYDQFVQNFGNGYRVDLCVWDWKSKPKKLSRKSKSKVKVKAQAGWQSTRVVALAGTTYNYVTEGEWRLDAMTKTDANGNEYGNGRLEGVLYKDFKLSEPFDLGKEGNFVAPSDGHLYVRCKDDWTDLANNDGTIQVVITKSNDKP